MENISSNRDVTLDVLRGLAIFLMVQDNIASSIFGQPLPRWGELYVVVGSFVPALFIMLAGMMVVYTTINKGYKLKHFLLRAGALMLTAVFIVDIFIWGLMPFLSSEVLYLIALSLPVAYLFQRFSAGVRWGTVAAIFAATPMLQSVFGYTPYPTEMSITGITTLYGSLSTSGGLQHWFIDGWFPIFPWLGVALVGVNIGIIRWGAQKTVAFNTKKVIMAGAALILSGVLIQWLFPVSLYIRGGFSEIIYPATIAYLAFAFGEIALLFALFDWKPEISVYKPLIVFGESSLFMYWFHFGVIELLPVYPSLQVLLGLFVFVLSLMLLIAYALRHIRKRWPKRPLWLKYFFGV